jgi:DEAD/DEAH box helicase domain-containing protein
VKRITFDIETAGEFRGNGDFSNLEITMVCTHDAETGQLQSFLKEELGSLWPILERADMLVGYNSEHFDIPILNRYYTGDLSKIRSVDLLREVKNVLGRRLRLDSIAEATLGKKKSGSGPEAQVWWKNGEIDKVRQYCMDDVKITNDLYEYAKKHGHLKYMDFEGKREIKLDTSNWEKPQDGGPAMTHTLPF